MTSTVGRRLSQVAIRCLHTRRKTKDAVALPQALVANFPVKKVSPSSDNVVVDPSAIDRTPVTSAHAIDLEKGQISTQDSVAVSPSGSVVHGRYGDLGEAADGIPLEYLALLRNSAEGAAAVRMATAKSNGPGTLLVFGASQVNGFSAAQLAAARERMPSCHAPTPACAPRPSLARRAFPGITFGLLFLQPLLL